MRRALAAAGVMVLVAALGFGVALARDARLHQGRILPGVSIHGVSVGGLTPTEARGRVQAVVAVALARTIAIHAGGAINRPRLVDLGWRPEYDQAVAAAYALGRQGNLLARLRDRRQLRQGIDVPLQFAQDEQVLRSLVSRLAAAAAREPQDAAVTVIDDTVVVTRTSQDGRRLDVEETAARLRRAIAAGAGEVEAAVQIIRPRLTTEAALSITTPVARYSTRFVHIPNRNHNIRLAAGKLRGVLLLPGMVFSYNQTVGPRTPELGYLPAPVLLNNILVPGDGGGVCQVSSTLFNVALLADLTIVERHNHTRPVAYLPIGRDATVVYGGQDLRFQNQTGSPLLLWSQVQGRRLTITLFGPAGRGREVHVLVTDRVEIPAPTHTVTRTDPELPWGETVIDPPQPGYRVRTYRVVRQDGVEVKRELIARSTYTPLPRTIRIGGKRTPAPQAQSP